MARQQDGDAGGPLLRDERADDGPRLRVHAGGRLVEDQDLGPTDQREREAEPLPLPARQAAERGGRHGPQAQHVQQLVRVARIVVEPGVLDDRLARSRPKVDAAGLEHQAHAGSQRATTARRILAQDPHRPVVGAPVALDDLDRRRLARAVGAEQATSSPGATVNETPSTTARSS